MRLYIPATAAPGGDSRVSRLSAASAPLLAHLGSGDTPTPPDLKAIWCPYTHVTDDV